MENKILVATGDINKEYEIISFVRFVHNSHNNKYVFDKKNLDSVEFFDAALGKLQDEAIKLDADAIINFRVDTQLFAAGYLRADLITMVGTAVKLK